MSNDVRGVSRQYIGSFAGLGSLIGTWTAFPVSRSLISLASFVCVDMNLVPTDFDTNRVESLLQAQKRRRGLDMNILAATTCSAFQLRNTTEQRPSQANQF
jgi:hypothetical protein